MFRPFSIFRYVGTFRRYIGRRLYVAFVLTLFAGATEGLGIALLLPLVSLMDARSGESLASNGAGDVSKLDAAVRGVLESLGIRNSMTGILLLIAVVFGIKGLIKFAEGSYKTYLESQLMRELRARLFDAYSKMSFRYYSQHNTGHFINLINVQIHALVTAFDRYARFITALITLLMYFAFALLISWRFASMALVAGTIVLVVFRRMNYRVRSLSRKTASENGKLNHFLVQTMQAYKYLAATGQMGSLRASVVRSINTLAGHVRSQGMAQALAQALNEPLSVAVLVSIVMVQILVLEAPLAPILVALVLIYRAMNQLVTLQVNWLASMKHIGSLEVVEKEFSAVANAQRPDGGTTVSSFSNAIRLENVSFAYGTEDQVVLHNINVIIPANWTIALVGESGAGKSTLVDILTLMLRPTGGQLTVDGVPHQQIKLDSWRCQIGYVSQETVVFDDTIANNISLWSGDYNADPDMRRRIEHAAERAYARHFIERLPDGFNTRVGDRGVRLSGGQRQRLFIARELYKNPRLLILDEATSALDSESESVIKRSIDQLKGTTTVVIIAHRLSTITNADYIYVLEKGSVAEEGRYEDLVTSENGSFKRMVALQKL